MATKCCERGKLPWFSTGLSVNGTGPGQVGVSVSFCERKTIMKREREQKVTVAGIVKDLLPKVQGINKKLREDLELLDYVEPKLAKDRPVLKELISDFDGIEQDLRGINDSP